MTNNETESEIARFAEDVISCVDVKRKKGNLETATKKLINKSYKNYKPLTKYS